MLPANVLGALLYLAAFFYTHWKELVFWNMPLLIFISVVAIVACFSYVVIRVFPKLQEQANSMSYCYICRDGRPSGGIHCPICKTCIPNFKEHSRILDLCIRKETCFQWKAILQTPSAGNKLKSAEVVFLLATLGCVFGLAICFSSRFHAFLIGKSLVPFACLWGSLAGYLETLGVLLSSAAGVFRYNRTNFRFDWLQKQESQYHLAKMRLEQYTLYREDVADLCDLTLSRMDSYLFVSTVTVLVSLALFYEGRVPVNTPAWLFFLWASSVTSAFLYLLLSQWFSIQASVHAQTFKTVLRTRWLRLPLPSYEETSSLAPHLEDFERGSADQLLRIPMSRMLIESETRDASLPENGDVHFTEHFLLYQELQRTWRSYDAFARVSLVVGTNQFLLAAVYTGIAYFGYERSEWAYWGLIALFVGFGLGHAEMNLLISRRRMLIFAFLYCCSPVMAGVINAFFRLASEPSKVALPVMYAVTVLAQLLALGFLVMLTMETPHADSLMPHKFATVQLLDVLGLDPHARPRYARETAVADAVPRAKVVARGLDSKGAMSFDTREGDDERRTTSSGDEDLDEPTAAETLPVQLFQSMSLVILCILLWGLIQSTLVAFGLTSFGWENVNNAQMVILETLAAVTLGAKDLFMYNRKGFMFNILQGQEATYRIQDNRLIQTLLCREDALDLFGLSLKRMHLYALVSTVLLLIALGIVAHGELPKTTPAWLFYMWAVSSISSVLFLFVATWFSVLASVSAQILLTRMRTQWLRLPLASLNQIGDVAVRVEEFEKGEKSMRIPVVSQEITTQPVTRSSSISDLAGFTDHFILYQELIALFQGYESFGRIALVFGISQLASSIAYMALVLAPLSQWTGTIAFVCFGLLVNISNLYINLLVSKYSFSFLVGVVVLGPVSAVVATTTDVGEYLSLVTMASELLSLAVVTGFAMKMERGLPLLFSSVVQLDLFGFLMNKSTAEVANAIPTAPVISRSLEKAVHHVKEGESILAKEDGDLIKQHMTRDLKQHRRLTDDTYLVDDDASQAGSFFFICYTCLGLWFAGLVISCVKAANADGVILGWVNSFVD